MSEKTGRGLANWAQEWLGRPYWYGTACYHCTESLLSSKKKQYPKHYTSDRMSRYRKDIANDMWAADCIGLAKGYMWWDDKLGRTRYATNGCPDKSANGMLDASKVNGDIATLPETPGVMLWKDGHVGIYIGGGYAVEARGFDYGIVRTAVRGRGWQKWFELPGCDYNADKSDGEDDQATQANAIRVTGKSVNVRIGPSVDYKSVGVVNVGEVYSGVEEIQCPGWRAIEYRVSIQGAQVKSVCWISANYSEVMSA